LIQPKPQEEVISWVDGGISLASAAAFLGLVVEAFLRDLDFAFGPIVILAPLPVGSPLLPVNELPLLIGRPDGSHVGKATAAS